MNLTFIMVMMAVCAYILGSVPSAVWIGRLARGVDVREHGSRNAGTTNVMRVLGVGIGIPVLVIDILKGFTAVKLSCLLPDTFSTAADSFINFKLMLGAIAVLGHIFPVLAGFRGGKGVATVVGVLLAMHWQSTLIAGGVFFAVLLISKYVSISSMMMGLSFPVSVIFIFNTQSTSLKIFSVVICILLFITHTKNILRLLRGKENKATFLFKKKSYQK